MKIACNVIQDLLPLYVEEISSEESNELIEEHIATCEKCRKELEKLKCSDAIEEYEPTEPVPFKQIKKNIESRKWLVVSFVSSIVFLVIFTVFTYLIKPVYLSYQDSGITVTMNENNELYAQFSDQVTACRLNQYQTEDGKDIVEIEAWTSIWDNMIGKESTVLLVASSDTDVDTVYYSENLDGENRKLVYGEDPNPNGGEITLPRLVLGYYFWIACITAVLLGVVWIIMRKNQKAYQVCRALFFVPVSYILGAIELQNGFVTYSATFGFVTNLIAAIAIYTICMTGMTLYRQYRQDRIV